LSDETIPNSDKALIKNMLTSLGISMYLDIQP
jgi:hypothetical protein